MLKRNEAAGRPPRRRRHVTFRCSIVEHRPNGCGAALQRRLRSSHATIGFSFCWVITPQCARRHPGPRMKAGSRVLDARLKSPCFFGQPTKCDAAHTSLRLFPTKIRQPGNQEGTHGTKTSYRRRDCSCNGVDHPNGHGVGHAELVTDFRSSTFAFVLDCRRPASFTTRAPWRRMILDPL